MQLPDDLIPSLDEALEDTQLSAVLGMAAAILSPAGSWFGATGVADVASNILLQPDDRFEAGSITKTFIATPILQLVEEGQSLDDMQLPDDVIQSLDEALEGSRPSEVPGVAAAILSPAGSWFGATGVADIANNTPLQPDDRFEAGSITKTFVATTMLQLVEEGQLSLDDTLTDWLPATLTERVPNASNITIKQILNHTSGVADYSNILGEQARTNPLLFLREWQPEQLLDFINGVEPLFAPGESWQYSNTNYILAGLVIESVTGNTYASEIRDRIIAPLNLQNTFIAGAEDIPGGYVKGYWDYDGNGTLDDLSITNLSWAGSAGSLISNTADLATFFDGLFKGNLLQPETLAQMLDTIPIDSPNYDSYGLGIGTLELRNGTWYAHRGQTLGFRSNIWYSPDEDITYVELINGSSDDNIVGDLLPTFRNGLANKNRIEGQGSDDTLAGYLGNDTIFGGAGNDILRGDLNSRSAQDNVEGGDDIIFGGDGNDHIGGKSGHDILRGGAGDDKIWGDHGDDILIGGFGNDILVGDNFSGSGSDLFVLGNADVTDTILDFEVGIDRIGLVEGELVFADLTLTQDGSNTLLGVASSDEVLAILNNVQASVLSQSSFAVFSDVSS